MRNPLKDTHCELYKQSGIEMANGIKLKPI